MRLLKPMNACALKGKKYHLLIEDKRNYITQEKLKGIRALLYFEADGINIVSRGGHDISRNFPHISELIFPEHAGTVLDCELYQSGVEDEIVAGWGNWRKSYINREEVSGVVAACFDILRRNHMLLTDDTLYRRLIHLADIFGFLKVTHGDIPIKLLQYRLPSESKDEYFNFILSQGGEGIMLKNLNASYWEGERKQNNWYKLKGEEDFDVVITGFEQADAMSIKKGDTEATPTKFNGLIGAFTYGMYWNGALLTLGKCSGMDNKTRIDMTDMPEEWIGKVAKIVGVEQKPSGAIDNPRYIRLRLDKRPIECVWEREK